MSYLNPDMCASLNNGAADGLFVPNTTAVNGTARPLDTDKVRLCVFDYEVPGGYASLWKPHVTCPLSSVKCVGTWRVGSLVACT